MREFFVVSVFAFWSLVCFAQQNDIKSIEFGIKGGLSNYQGDLVRESINIGETHLSFGAYGRIFLNKNVGIQLGVNFVTITANDRNYADTPGPDRYDRGIKITSSIVEYTGRIEYFPYMDRSPLYYSWLHFQPYFGTGISIIWNNLEFEDQNINNGLIEPEIESPIFSFPLIFGLKYVIKQNMSISAETCFNVTLTDRLDGYTFGNNNDWYMFHSISMAWHFTNGSRYNQVRERKKVRARNRWR